jgi:hypothetical protein
VGLRNQPGQGRKAILTDSDKPLVKSRVQASPQQLKQACLGLKEELNKEFSTKTLQRFLKTLAGRAGGVVAKV